MQKHQVLDAFVPTESLNGFVLVRNLPTVHISKILCKHVELAGECATFLSVSPILTADLIENTQRYYEIYSILLPVCTVSHGC
jgi:hypothetical protein